MLSLCALLSYGCGYSLAPGNSTIPRGQSIDVKMFANRTYQPNIEAMFRSALVNEMVARGDRVSGELSEFIVSGEIASFTMDTAAYSSIDTARLYRAVAEIQMQLSERKSGKVVWKGSETISQEYPANSDLALQRNANEAAVSAICTKGAQLLLLKMNQSF